MNELDNQILEYLGQEQRGVGVAWLMAVTGREVGAVLASVVRLEGEGLISPGPGPWPLYKLPECQQVPFPDDSRGLSGC